MTALTVPGYCSRNSVRTIRCVVTNWPSGHKDASSTSTLPLPSWISRVAHGSGTHAPSMSPAWKVASVSGVGLRLDAHIATARSVGAVALFLQPRTQRDVLRVAQLRCRQDLAR